MLFVSTGCTDRKSGAEDSCVADTFVADTLKTDSLETLVEEMPMPKAADELFLDFFFNYAASRKLQRERTDFPLTHSDYGTIHQISKAEWVPERFFIHQGYYTQFFNSRRQQALDKDTTIGSVVLEKIQYSKNSLKEWHFNRVDGLWRLQGIATMSLSKYRDADFVKFYHQFATDSVFQQNSLAELVNISAPDPDDDFSRIDGEVMPEQWPMFAPWMPTDDIYNIHFGKAPYKQSDERIFMICGVASGLATEMTFRRNGDRWILVKMEN